MIVGVLLLLGACTPSSTSADDTGGGNTGDAPGQPPSDDGDPSLGGLTRVTGTLSTAELTGALDAPATLPLVLSVPAGGGGNGAVLTGIAAQGGNTIVWDGGRPITLSGDGNIAVQPGPFRVSDGGLFADLSAAAHALSSGSYTVSGPVAVGDGAGLAAPSTETSFTAGADGVLSGTGQVEGRLPAGTWLLLGPGAVSLQGDLVSTTSDASVAVASAVMAAGSFEVTLTVGDDGVVTVDALLDGEVVAGQVLAGS